MKKRLMEVVAPIGFLIVMLLWIAGVVIFPIWLIIYVITGFQYDKLPPKILKYFLNLI